MKKGFTLIELMIAVSVLAVGIVVILHSRLAVIAALDSSANQMKAWRFLENKMNVLEQTIKEDGGIQEQGLQEEAMIGLRQGTWEIVTSPVKMQVGDQEEEQEVGLLKVTMSLSWKEGHKDKGVVLVTYLPEKTEEE